MIKAHTVSKNSKTGLAASPLPFWASMLSALVVTAVLFFSLNAFAADTHKQTMQYDVYAGGFHVVEAELNVDLETKNKYDLSLDAHTRGFLGRLAPWNGTFETQGWYNTKTQKAQPQQHRSTTTWRDEEEIKTYLYNKDGTFKDYTIKEHDKELHRPKPDSELTENSTDVLTGTLDVMNRLMQTDGLCTGESEIFDGKRRYKMIFQEEERVELTASRYNVYEGSAVQCTVEVQPMAGKWHEKPRGWMSIQEQGREQGTMPTVWMAQMSDKGPYVPVKIRVRTDYGVLFMHLTGYQSADIRYQLAEK